MSAYIDVQVTHDLLEYLALGDRTVIQGDHFGNALKREADLSGLPDRRSEQIRAVDDARLRAGLPALRIRTGRVATSSLGKDNGSGVRYSFRQQCRNG
jgi:hypothetical protein